MSNEKLFGIHAYTAGLRAQRAGVLASNLANADTPNFKARDLDFSAALARAGGGQLALRVSHARHLPAAGAAAGAGELRYRVPLQPSLDGNTVDSHAEHARFAENAVQYQTSLQFLDSRIKGLVKALRGE